MLIWIIAIVLFALLGGIGFSLGAIRLTASLLGLFIGSMLAMPLGHFFNPIVSACGVKNPILIWVLGPAIAFLVVLIIFNVIGIAIHHKVDVYYKYKAGDLRMGLWNRLNRRLGIPLGLANAAFYIVLIVKVVYPFSYATTQVVTGDSIPFSVKMLNDLGKSIQDSGMARVAASLDSMPASYYQAVDIVGLIYHNDLLEGRLSRYPALLALAERPEFQDIANDKDFTELRQKQPPIADILAYPKAQAILNNPDMLNQIWGTIAPNLTDMLAFLKTGKSEKYDAEVILGRWNFDLSGALNQLKRSNPKIGFQEMQRTKQLMSLTFRKTTFVATPDPDRLAVLKEVGKVRPGAKPNLPPTVDIQTFKGQWVGDGNKYQLTFPDKSSRGSLEAVVDGDRMIVSGDVYPMVFNREY